MGELRSQLDHRRKSCVRKIRVIDQEMFQKSLSLGATVADIRLLRRANI
jgi:hypothetical protein